MIGVNVAIAVSTFIFTGGPDIAAGFLTLDTGGPDIAAGFLIADTGGPDIAAGDSVLLTGCNCLTGVNDTAFCCCGFAIESLVVIGLSNAVLGSSSSSVTISSKITSVISSSISISAISSSISISAISCSATISSTCSIGSTGIEVD